MEYYRAISLITLKQYMEAFSIFGLEKQGNSWMEWIFKAMESIFFSSAYISIQMSLLLNLVTIAMKRPSTKNLVKAAQSPSPLN